MQAFHKLEKLCALFWWLQIIELNDLMCSYKNLCNYMSNGVNFGWFAPDPNRNIAPLVVNIFYETWIY